MKIIAIVCFLLAAVLAILAILAARAFINEYGFRQAGGPAAFSGLIVAAIPLAIGITVLRRSSKRRQSPQGEKRPPR